MINIDTYLLTHRQMPDLTEELALAVGGYGSPGRVFNFKWGEIQRSVRCAIIESGFLWDGLHLDMTGLYQFSSLNTPMGIGLMQQYSPPVSAQELMQEMAKHQVPQSKFRQHSEIAAGRDGNDFRAEPWDGVVLALQNPTDRSIMSGAHERDYYAFVEEACAFYGQRLFLKLHPWNHDDVEARFRALADKYGATIARADHRVLKGCEFCLVYNSTFAFDCFMRSVPVVQYAPGYFWQTGAVWYASRRFVSRRPDYAERGIQMAHRLCNFVIWRYMIHCKLDRDGWRRLLCHVYDHQDELFPVTPELSYAAEMLARYAPGRIKDSWIGGAREPRTERRTRSSEPRLDRVDIVTPPPL